MNPPKESYPLTWPDRWPRTALHGRRVSSFGGGQYRNTLTIAKAVETALHELRLLGAQSVIISTNLRLRLDGLPMSNQSQPADTGVAIYFNLKNKPRVLACDKWTKVEHNIWAISKHIEALRGQQRWGVGNIEQAFAGYAALPEKAGGVSWWEILQVPINATEEQINDAYRTLAKQKHPDAGGNHEDFVKLNEAYRAATAQKVK